jgi:ferredoxin
MPPKFKINASPTPPRHRPVGKLGIVDWREDCSSCKNCVKKGCVYDLYRDEANALREELGYLDYIFQCKGCLNCVQNCTKSLLTRVVNPEFKRLGDDTYTPEILIATWFQGATGAVPVSGAGYGGPFSGEGFDSMWTDMSEIVRPTRDGIHGREYINTGVEIGRKLSHLMFDGMKLISNPPPVQEIPMPLIIDQIPKNWRRGGVQEALIRTASTVGIKCVVPADVIERGIEGEMNAVIPLISSSNTSAMKKLQKTPLLMISDGPSLEGAVKAAKDAAPERIVIIRVDASTTSTERVLQLAENGAESIHLVFDVNGREQAAKHPRHARDVIREVHRTLVKAGVRDELSFSVSGGIALAEHMAKAVLCGADFVAADLPFIIAMECRLCKDCEKDLACQVTLEEAEGDFLTRRAVNLMSSWHSQLLEMMGAMGIREARRLRGETGRCMFFEDLEADTFGRLFGKRKADKGGEA